MSTTRGIAELTSREDGGVLVFGAMLLPVVLLFLALSVDIGNWWVHKRHLQLQVDAAALAGGALFGDCFTDPAGANVAIQNEATRFGGAGGSSYNEQVGGANKGSITLLYQSANYAAGSAPSDDTETQPPCETPSLMFDVKATETNLPLLFDFPGLDFVPSISAHARVQLKTVIQQDGMLPVAVPDLRFNYAFATFVNEATGADSTRVLFAERGGAGLDALAAASQRPTNVAALVGPEGGWDDEELELARARGWTIVTLGGRTLRAETAALAVCALLQHLFGDLG
ncbi:MAG: RsmE family RNA methyltransferase [Pyrinomonadaceae bacterium]